MTKILIAFLLLPFYSFSQTEFRITNQSGKDQIVELIDESNLNFKLILKSKKDTSFFLTKVKVYQVKLNQGISYFLFPDSLTINGIITSNKELVLSSFTSNYINWVDQLWVKHVKEIYLFQSQPERTNKILIAFEIIAEAIIKVDNPVVADFLSSTLFSIENMEENTIPINKFIDFKLKLEKKYPKYQFELFEKTLKYKFNE